MPKETVPQKGLTVRVSMTLGQCSCHPLPTTNYPLAIEHLVMVRNLLPKGIRKIAAYESLTKQDPKKILNRLHIFGSKAYVHNQKDDITKMQEKTFEGIYIGYDLISEYHKIFNIATGKIILTVNVKIENKTDSRKIKLDKKKDSISTDKIEDVLE